MTDRRSRALRGLWACAALLLATAGPSPLAAQHASEAPVSHLLDDFVARHGFNGVVLVAHGDSVVALRASGDADVEHHVRTAVDTRYELGSIAKWIASVVVLKLAEQGKVALDAPITTYLPDHRRDTGARVTLHHLLTHTSGIPNDVVAALRADSMVARASLPAADAVRRYASGDLQFAPGARFDYSHANWVVVRAIVERVTGRSYADVVQSVLWTPLDLTGSGTFVGDFTQRPGSARGYTALTPAPRRRVVPMPDFMAAAGGSYATARDLLALLHGVYGGAVLSPSSLALLNRVYVPAEHYAYGSRVRTLTLGGRATPVAWHAGSNGAFKSLAVRVLADGWTVIVLGNASPDQGAMATLAADVLHAVH
ncbi:MAG: serine hydrolase domain-containing protein [Gemmatirosa sp.]